MSHRMLKRIRGRLDVVLPWHPASNRVALEAAPQRRAAARPFVASPAQPLCSDWLALRTWEDDGGETFDNREVARAAG